jgi:hypothetical protein
MNGNAGLCDRPAGSGSRWCPDRHKQPQEFAMTESKKTKPASPDALAKTSPKGAVELSETQLAGASGGAVFPSSPATAASLNFSHKASDSNPALLLPAVKPGV